MTTVQGSLAEPAGLSGKTGLIIGGGYGIGREIARTAAAPGVEPAIVEQDRERVAAVADERGAVGIRCDVPGSGSARSAFGEARARLGAVDVTLWSSAQRSPRPVPGPAAPATLQSCRPCQGYSHFRVAAPTVPPRRHAVPTSRTSLSSGPSGVRVNGVAGRLPSREKE
jgi:NAD(P)-dependent dehydrogenase (short-subunit alcohol dehydrogenase family)